MYIGKSFYIFEKKKIGFRKDISGFESFLLGQWALSILIVLSISLKVLDVAYCSR